MLHSVWRRSGPRRARPLACEQLEDRSLLSFIVQTPFHATGTNPAVPVTADFFQHNQLDLAVTNNNLGGTNGSVAIYENTTSSPTDDSVVAVATFENGPATAALSIAWT